MSDDGVVALWDPVGGKGGRRWLRLQVCGNQRSHLAFVHKVRALSSSQPVVARIDIALDYPVSPRWLLLDRPLAPTYERIEDKAGTVTYSAGARGGRLFVRVYDSATRHGLEPPMTRIEAEYRPSPQVTMSELASGAFPNPFKDIALYDLYAPDLDTVELLLLKAAQCTGVAALRRSLPAPDQQRLDSAIAKAKSAPRLFPPRDVYEERWTYLREEMVLHDLA